MKPTTYLIYHESTGEWSTEPVTLAAARALPGVTLSTYLSTTDGARQLTVAQAIGEEQAAAAPAPTPAAHREPVYNAETNKWEYKEAAASVFNKIKSVASGIITEINEACKEQAEAAREQHREPVYTLGGIPLETEPPKSAPVPSSPAPVPADTRSVPAEAVPVPPAGASVPNSGKQRKEYKVIEYTEYHNRKFDAEGLEMKLNRLAAQGWQVIGVSSPTTDTTGTLAQVFGGSGVQNLHGVIIILER